jgi:hypothetical protein
MKLAAVAFAFLLKNCFDPKEQARLGRVSRGQGAALNLRPPCDPSNPAGLICIDWLLKNSYGFLPRWFDIRRSTDHLLGV